MITGWINYILQNLNYYTDKLEEATGSRIYLMYLTGLGFIFVGNVVYFVLHEKYEFERQRIILVDKHSRINLDEKQKYETQIKTLKKQKKYLVNKVYKFSVNQSILEGERKEFINLESTLNKEYQYLFNSYNKLKKKYKELEKEYNYITSIIRAKNGYITRENN